MAIFAADCVDRQEILKGEQKLVARSYYYLFPSSCRAQLQARNNKRVHIEEIKGERKHHETNRVRMRTTTKQRDFPIFSLSLLQNVIVSNCLYHVDTRGAPIFFRH